MKTLKFELAIAGVALFGLGAFYAMQRSDAGEVAVPPLTQFTANDFRAFDRNFTMDDAPCAVGFKAHKICFGSSPFEKSLAIGDVLDQDVPILAAEFRVIVETDLKVERLRTVRFGQTLVLIDPQTRKVEDMIRLSENSLDAARKPLAPPSET